MTDKETETRGNDPGNKDSNIRVMVSVGDLVNLKPRAKAKPQSDEQRKPKPKNSDD